MGDIVYVRIRPHLVSVKNVSKNIFFEDVPQIMVDRASNRILGFGRRINLIASMSAEKVVLNGFDHPRSIISDYDVAEKTLRLFIKEVSARKIKSMYVPTLVIHPLEKLEGGLTQVEARALEDLGYRAVAKDVYVWNGRELSDEEIISLKFPPEGRCYRKKR